MTHLPVLGVPVQSKSPADSIHYIDRPDARWHTSWDIGHRYCWSQECWIAGSANLSPKRSRLIATISSLGICANAGRKWTTTSWMAKRLWLFRFLRKSEFNDTISELNNWLLWNLAVGLASSAVVSSAACLRMQHKRVCYHVSVFEREENCPAAQAADRHIVPSEHEAEVAAPVADFARMFKPLRLSLRMCQLTGCRLPLILHPRAWGRVPNICQHRFREKTACAVGRLSSHTVSTCEIGGRYC